MRIAMANSGSVECIWEDPSGHPQCPHGPTLLFSRFENSKEQRFYACSACRDRKLCKFYLEHGEKMSKLRAAKWEKEKKSFTSQYHRLKLFVRFNHIMAETQDTRCYCHTCERLMLTTEKEKHVEHDITEHLTDDQMNQPTMVLKPLENVKKEAQYLFSKKAVEDIVLMLSKLDAKQVLCIGAPTIHEYITGNQNKMSSLLMDIDGRFNNFFGPLTFCWYNLFNHHFFNDDSIGVFKDFMTRNEGKDTYLICDPPFGGRVEAMSWTVKKITDLHKKWNKIDSEKDGLKVMFIFPYFMEHIMRRKSNPPNIDGGLKDLKMSDYKVDYDNHPLFITEAKKNKMPTPVRIFTNIPLNLLELPESDGYKYCKKCEKWVASENKHCKKCKECTSKDGRTYHHCDSCKRCIKPTWKHCDTCERCAPEEHKCGSKPKVTGRCFKCNELGHTEMDCPEGTENKVPKAVAKKRKKQNSLSEPEPAKRLKSTKAKAENGKPVKENKKLQVSSKQQKKGRLRNNQSKVKKLKTSRSKIAS